MNPLLGALSQNSGGSKMNLFMQAIAAASRGETPEDFLKSVAQHDSRFQGLDLDNLERTANQLCQKKGVSMQDAMNQVQSEISSFT